MPNVNAIATALSGLDVDKDHVNGATNNDTPVSGEVRDDNGMDAVTDAMAELNVNNDVVGAYLAKHAGSGGRETNGGSGGNGGNGGTVNRDSHEPDLLALWQALCLEFGLVADPAEPTHTDSDLPALPSTKTQARLLLNTRAHVNIVDYVIARRDTPLPIPYAHFAHLVYPTAGTLIACIRKGAKRAARRRYRMRRAARRRGMSENAIQEMIDEVIASGSKVFPRELAKSEGLQVLLRGVF